MNGLTLSIFENTFPKYVLYVSVFKVTCRWYENKVDISFMIVSTFLGIFGFHISCMQIPVLHVRYLCTIMC